jgi:hypothetical protein
MEVCGPLFVVYVFIFEDNMNNTNNTRAMGSSQGLEWKQRCQFLIKPLRLGKECGVQIMGHESNPTSIDMR